jgi:selenocysteine lyase/cysteine desulfurase
MDSIASRVRGDFPGLRGVVHLNAASMGAAPRVALEAVAGQLALLDRGPAGGPWSRYVADFESHVEIARAEAAKLLGARADEVGLAQDTTSGLHHAIDAIPFRRGDNIVVSDLEYPQVGLAAANAAREDGVEIRWVKHRAGRLTIDDHRAVIDGRTRALLVSSVGWVTGQRIDLAALSELADERGFFLVVDAVQQLGGLAIDCSKLRVDFLMAGGYKWLNAPFGVGVLYVRREAHERGLRLRRLGLLGLEPPSGGWAGYYARPDMVALPAFAPSASVRRFEAQGTPNRLGSAGLAASLRYRNAVGDVDRAILELSGELHEALRSAGAAVLTPEAERDRAGIVTFTLDADPATDARVRDFLESRRIYVSARYCAGVGGVRAAVHYWNDRDDVAALVGAVREFRRR